MSTLRCPKGCNAGWLNATQTIKRNGETKQEAMCAGCFTVVKSTGGVVMDRVNGMHQDRR